MLIYQKDKIIMIVYVSRDLERKSDKNPWSLWESATYSVIDE